MEKINCSCEIDRIISYIPKNGEKSIDWSGLEKTSLENIFVQMKKTPQDSIYHGEGDVFVHTQRVCESLVNMPEYESCTNKEKEILFLSALLHDYGKTRCTRYEDGRITSKGHAVLGSFMTRELLWRDFGLCGIDEKRNLREAVCSLVRYHSFPPYSPFDIDAQMKIYKIASIGELINEFSLRLLYILEKADVAGREFSEKEAQFEKVEYFKMLAEENECFVSPWRFSSDFSKRAFFKGKIKWKEQSLYNDSVCNVIMICGLPGTGKDRWIEEKCSNLPMISLDDIRRRLNVSPTEKQGKVVYEAHEIAREYLRKKQGFVWNATNITALMREKQISLFEKYNASVESVFLETQWNEQLRRNASRREKVPENIIEKLLSKTEPPLPFECEKVLWKTT